jgi:hypothetical protein
MTLLISGWRVDAMGIGAIFLIRLSGTIRGIIS